jgi:glycosyltransferase involved in cell wall biosynthesis
MTSTAAPSRGDAPETLAGRRKRVLLVTYPFPPVGGAGVQRVTKFVKYLPRHGWDVSVLTVANPSVPLYDDSLRGDVPPETLVCRARSWEPGYALKATVSAGGAGGQPARRGLAKRLAAGSLRQLAALVLQPDPQVLWRPGAMAAGKRLLREQPHDVILASGPPFSTFLIGAALGRSARRPVVLDYRDEWTLSNAYWENKRLGAVSRFVQNRMQRRAVRASSGLLATTRSSAESLRTLAQQAGSAAKVSWIYNGFDPEDFHAPAEQPDAGRFRLAYVGTLWNLTNVAPLVEAVDRLAREQPALAGKLELVFAGRRTGPQSEQLARLRGLPCRLVEHPYLDHSAAVSLMRGAGALCLLLSDLPGAGRVVPAKLFEYMATGRPILAVAPRGEMWDLLNGFPACGRFESSDVAGIASWLATMIREPATPSAIQKVDVSAYNRDHEAGQLAAFLDSLNSPVDTLL